MKRKKNKPKENNYCRKQNEDNIEKEIIKEKTNCKKAKLNKRVKLSRINAQIKSEV